MVPAISQRKRRSLPSGRQPYRLNRSSEITLGVLERRHESPAVRRIPMLEFAATITFATLDCYRDLFFRPFTNPLHFSFLTSHVRATRCLYPRVESLIESFSASTISLTVPAGRASNQLRDCGYD